MEARAPYTTATPQGPRNLAPQVAAWLRTQGFTATEQQLPHTHYVHAHWLGPHQERYELTYLWVAGPVREASCQLRVLYYGALPLSLFSAQRVRRLKDVRQLLTGCVRYHNARVLARVPVATDL